MFFSFTAVPFLEACENANFLLETRYVGILLRRNPPLSALSQGWPWSACFSDVRAAMVENTEPAKCIYPGIIDAPTKRTDYRVHLTEFRGLCSLLRTYQM